MQCFLCFGLALVVALAGPNLAAADCLFVNTNSGSNTVAAFQVNPDGTLTPAHGSPFATGGLGDVTSTVASASACAGRGLVYSTRTRLRLLPVLGQQADHHQRYYRQGKGRQYGIQFRHKRETCSQGIFQYQLP